MLERLDKLVETTPKALDQAGRAKRFDDLKRQRELASIALGDLQTKLVKSHGPLAGQVATLSEIQAALAPDTALVTWVDVNPAGPNAADPDGEHWGVVVRSRGIAGLGASRELVRTGNGPKTIMISPTAYEPFCEEAQPRAERAAAPVRKFTHTTSRTAGEGARRHVR